MLERMRQQEVSEGVRNREECTWRLEPQGETEVPNIIIVSDAVGGTKVDPDGEGHGRKRMKDITKKRKQPKGADWAEMSKEEEKLKCALLKGSA